MLGIPGATVAEVTFTPEGVVVALCRRLRRLSCPCGFKARAAYDVRSGAGATSTSAPAGSCLRGRPQKGSSPPEDKPRWIKHTRRALLKDPADLKGSQLEVLHRLRRERSVLYRCWQLKKALRDLYRLRRPQDAPSHLDWWLAWACRSRIPAFVKLSKTIRANRDRILVAIALGLSNSKLEGLNSKIRLINHRGYGHHSAAPLISMIYLCCGGITVQLPTER